MAETRTFTKLIDGRTEVQVAGSAAEAVRLRFAGWSELVPAEPQPSAKTTAAKKTQPKADK